MLGVITAVADDAKDAMISGARHAGLGPRLESPGTQPLGELGGCQPAELLAESSPAFCPLLP